MRWQRQSVLGGLIAGDFSPACRRLMPSIAAASLLLACAIFVLAPAGPAGSEEIIADGRVDNVGHQPPESGMPASNPRVKRMLSAYPDEWLVICVAGCRDKPHIVQALRKPVSVRSGEMRTTSAGTSYDGGENSNAVVCLGGCSGRPGQVLQRLPLPPPPHQQHTPKKTASEPWYDKLIDDIE